VSYPPPPTHTHTHYVQHTHTHMRTHASHTSSSFRFGHVKMKTSQYKKYPTSGKFAGGIVFWRYFEHGVGIGFTKRQCEEMWGELRLDQHMVKTVPVPVPAPAVGADTQTQAEAGALINPTEVRVGDCLSIHWTDGGEDFTAVVTVCAMHLHTHTQTDPYNTHSAHDPAHTPTHRTWTSRVENICVTTSLTGHGCGTYSRRSNGRSSRPLRPSWGSSRWVSRRSEPSHPTQLKARHNPNPNYFRYPS
jgi:hypothetical protein